MDQQPALAFAFDPDVFDGDIRLIGVPHLVMPIADDGSALVVRRTSESVENFDVPDLAVVLAGADGRVIRVIALVKQKAEGDWLAAVVAEARRVHAGLLQDAGDTSAHRRSDWRSCPRRRS